MYAMLLAMSLAQGPDVPERTSRVIALPGGAIYSESIYNPKFGQQRPKSTQQQLDELLTRFENSKKAAHVFRPGGFAARVRR